MPSSPLTGHYAFMCSYNFWKIGCPRLSDKKYFRMKQTHNHGAFIIQKKVAIFAVTLILLSVSGAVAYGSPTIGVKKGDWIEYNVATTGSPPAAQDITWARIEILDIESPTFHANVTAKSVNGTISSSVRTFNFEEGQVQAWIIIPANLNPGDSFYDSSINNNVTVQGQLQKTVAGASRTITYTNTTERHKEWDKATGVYTQSVDNLGNYTIDAKATATNMWSPQIQGLEQSTFYIVIGIIMVAVFIIVILTSFSMKKRKMKTTKKLSN